MPEMSRSKFEELEAQAKELRRGIRAAQLRVALDKQRNRVTPPAVVRVANRKLPEVTLAASPLVRAETISQDTLRATMNVFVTEKASDSAAVTQPKEQHPASQ